MRSALSEGARRWVTTVSSLASTRGRARKSLRVLPAAGLSVVLVAIASSACGSAGGALGSPSPIFRPLSLIGPIVGTQPGSGPGLYRIVGCRSRGASLFTHGPRRHEVAIGFDDGPDPDTRAFVRMLARAHAPATFFMIGEQVTAGYRTMMLDELRNGDALGDHSFTHPDLTRTGNVRGQLQSTLATIRAQTGYTPCVFRPPYGSYNASVVRTARSLGLATVTWNVDPSDYRQPGTGAIERRVLAQVRPGSIIISHDGGGPRGQTLAAYPGIIAALRRRGYGVVTIPVLLGFRPVYIPCVRLCGGIGVPRRQVPRDAIFEQAT